MAVTTNEMNDALTALKENNSTLFDLIAAKVKSIYSGGPWADHSNPKYLAEVLTGDGPFVQHFKDDARAQSVYDLVSNVNKIYKDDAHPNVRKIISDYSESLSSDGADSLGNDNLALLNRVLSGDNYTKIADLVERGVAIQNNLGLSTEDAKGFSGSDKFSSFLNQENLDKALALLPKANELAAEVEKLTNIPEVKAYFSTQKADVKTKLLTAMNGFTPEATSTIDVAAVTKAIDVSIAQIRDVTAQISGAPAGNARMDLIAGITSRLDNPVQTTTAPAAPMPVPDAHASTTTTSATQPTPPDPAREAQLKKLEQANTLVRDLFKAELDEMDKRTPHSSSTRVAELVGNLEKVAESAKKAGIEVASSDTSKPLTDGQKVLLKHAIEKPESIANIAEVFSAANGKSIIKMDIENLDAAAATKLTQIIADKNLLTEMKEFVSDPAIKEQLNKLGLSGSGDVSLSQLFSDPNYAKVVEYCASHPGSFKRLGDILKDGGADILAAVKDDGAGITDIFNLLGNAKVLKHVNEENMEMLANIVPDEKAREEIEKIRQDKGKMAMAGKMGKLMEIFQPDDFMGYLMVAIASFIMPDDLDLDKLKSMSPTNLFGKMFGAENEQEPDSGRAAG